MRRLLQIVLNAEGTVGGEQRHVLHILDGLGGDEYESEVVTWDVPAFSAEVADRGIPVHTVSGERILDRALLRQMRAIMRAGSFDIVHLHGHRAGLLGRLAARSARVPAVVWTCHLPENKADRNPVLRWGYRHTLRNLDSRTGATIAVSEHVRTWLVGQGIGAGRVTVIENGVDCDAFRPMERDPALLAELGLDPGAPIVGSVARLTPQKGVDILIDAASRIAERSPEVQFLLVGTGPLEAEMKERARASGARFVFAGERSDIVKVLALFDVAVLSSLWEGLPYTMLEAMACGRPIVCSDIPILADVVAETGAARLFSTGDAESLFTQIDGFLADPAAAAAAAAAARRLASERYSIEHMRRSTYAVYDRLLGEERP